ncbi:hypothetical protein VTN77DRAFT_8474 [Rasamsonia byssochlamydoides]|uniref:uncharacterized protein n=1 Tax=Rasamsonia byssochlamydoides TaxID=89139 RepID=UPI0037428A15
MTATTLPVYTAEDVAAHKSANDMWIVIHGKVFNITDYLHEHPGGEDVLKEVAGTDATEAYEDVGHSDEATQAMQPYLIGTLKAAEEKARPKAVRLVQNTENTQVVREVSISKTKIGLLASSVGGLLVLYAQRERFNPAQHWHRMLQLLPSSLTLKGIHIPKGGFTNGFLAATALATISVAVASRKLTQMLQIESGFTKYPPHIKAAKRATINPHLAKGFLSPSEFKTLPLVRKDQLSSNVYRFVFALPNSTDIIGLPIGQHVAIKAVLDDGTSVTRSYTPVSNNLDLGRLELVIKCYPDGLLTGKYLAKLQIGDEVAFRGPKGAMTYRKGLCKKMGMIAGGTGITPMYQLIRAICEDEHDTTEISLIYANRTEADILLRAELDAFAVKYPRNFKVWYMLDNPGETWKFGRGFVTKEVMMERLFAPDPETKVMLCGPPGMVNAAKKALVEMGFAKPAAVSKMEDQIFCF